MAGSNWHENLKRLRKLKGKTQAETATSINVSQQTIANWEKLDGTNPSIEELYLLTKFLGISLGDLFNDVGNNQKRSFQKQQQNVGDNVGNSVGNKPKNYATNDVLTVTGEEEAEYKLTEKAAHGLNDISAAFQAVEATLMALNTNITNLEGRITLMEDKQKKSPR